MSSKSGYTVGDFTFSADEVRRMVQNRLYGPIASMDYEISSLPFMPDPMSAANQIAEAFKPYGPMIVNVAHYRWNGGEFKTVMDMLLEPEDSWGRPGCLLLACAFKNAGFKYASECTVQELRADYATGCFPAYGYYRPVSGRNRSWELDGVYELQEIKEAKAQLHKELIEYLSHPNKLQQ